MKSAEIEKKRRRAILALLGSDRVADMEALVKPYDALPDEETGVEWEWKPGIKICQLRWGFYVEGRIEDLLRYGFGAIDWYPDGTECDGYRIRRTNRLWLLDGTLVEVRMKTRRRYWIMVDLTTDPRADHSNWSRHTEYKSARRAAREDQAFRTWLRALLKSVRAMPIEDGLTE